MMTPHDTVTPNPLADAVMARLADEPIPTPTRAAADAVGRGDLGAAVRASGAGWRLATHRAGPATFGMRVRGAALALGVSGLLASSGAIAFAGMATVAYHAVEQVGLVAPAATPQQDAPAATPVEAGSPEPAATPAVAATAHPAALPPDDHDKDLAAARTAAGHGDGADDPADTSATDPGDDTTGADDESGDQSGAGLDDDQDGTADSGGDAEEPSATPDPGDGTDGDNASASPTPDPDATEPDATPSPAPDATSDAPESASSGD